MTENQNPEQKARDNVDALPFLFESTGVISRFTDARPRALIQTATGAGKTYMAITSIYRLRKAVA